MMSFINDSEHLIFMDTQVRYEEPLIRLPADDIKALVDAGIRTAMVFNFDWDTVEPVQGQRNWQYFEDRVGLLNDCGMKTLVQCFTFIPKWVPDDWCVKTSNGTVMRMISPWNFNAYHYAMNFITEHTMKFNIPGKSMSINSWLTDGETLFPNEPCVYDDCAVGVFIDQYGHPPAVGVYDHEIAEFTLEAQVALFSDIQSTFGFNANKEIWHALHPALAGFHGNGCDNIETILSVVKQRMPELSINHLYCTWVQWSNYWSLMTDWKNRFGEKIWGGAEYAEGVVNTSRIAIEQGARGLLIGPCHPYTGHRRIEPWMLQNIKTAGDMWVGV